jgi:hypothetical protein
MLQSHPFTIVSLSWPISLHGRNELVLLIRACKGFTKEVAELAFRHSTRLRNFSFSDPLSAIAEAQKLRIHTRSWIDGPYGDFHPGLDRQYQGVVCVAGGSGITSSLPWLVYLANKMRSASLPYPHSDGKECKTRTVTLVWSVRSLEWIKWAEREISEALHDVMRANKPMSGSEAPELLPPTPGQAKTGPSKGKLEILIYVTAKDVDEVDMKMAGLDLLLGAGVEVDNPNARVEIIAGRPNYSSILSRVVDKKRNIVLGWYHFPLRQECSANGV